MEEGGDEALWGKEEWPRFLPHRYSAAYGISLVSKVPYTLHALHLCLTALVDQVELIVGDAPLNLSPASGPFATSFILFIGGELLLLFSIFQAFHIPKPFKISSLGKGAMHRHGHVPT